LAECGKSSVYAVAKHAVGHALDAYKKEDAASCKVNTYMI
jgi:hypothetical protein